MPCGRAKLYVLENSPAHFSSQIPRTFFKKKIKNFSKLSTCEEHFNFGHWKQKPWHCREVLSDSFDQPKLQLYIYWKCPLLYIYIFITDKQLYKKKSLLLNVLDNENNYLNFDRIF